MRHISRTAGPIPSRGDEQPGVRTTSRPLRIAVGLNRLWLAGAEINALDLATQARIRGHHVELFAQDEDNCPMLDLAASQGFQFTLLPRGRTRDLVAPLTSLVAQHHIDVVHGYYERMSLVAYLGPMRRLGTPLVSTYYGNEPPRGLPPYAHLIVGTRDLELGLRAWYGRPVSTMVPPVDTSRDFPGCADTGEFLRGHGLTPSHMRVVVVSRLERDMKLEGIARLMRSIAALDRGDVDLVVVGSGDGEGQARQLAAQVNAKLGRSAVTLTGRLSDPRAAYDCADVVVGMGGSALRGLAFGKPVIVVGENGFALPFAPHTQEYFFERGFFGFGALMDLTMCLQTLLGDAGLRNEWGALGLRCVTERFSLEKATGRLLDIYGEALQHRLGKREWLRGAAFALGYEKSAFLRRLEDARRSRGDELARIATARDHQSVVPPVASPSLGTDRVGET